MELAFINLYEGNTAVKRVYRVDDRREALKHSNFSTVKSAILATNYNGIITFEWLKNSGDKSKCPRELLLELGFINQ